MSEQQGDERREAVEPCPLRQPQDHPGTLQLSKHHGVVVGSRQAQAQPEETLQITQSN